MSMKALGRSSARRGLAPALKKEDDILKLVLITLYRGVAFEDIMNKYKSLTDPFLAPSLAKVAFPVVAYFGFHLYLLYISLLAAYKAIYEHTTFGHYVAGWAGRLAEQYNAWQESRLPRVIPPPIRVKIDEDPKLQPVSPLSAGGGTAAAAAAAAAEVSSAGKGLRSSPDHSPRGGKRGMEASSSESAASSSASSSSVATDSAASSATRSSDAVGASSSMSSLSDGSSAVTSDSDDDEKDAVPFPFSNEQPPRSSPRASLESSDESRAAPSSSALSHTPDFATPPQSPMPVAKESDNLSEKSEKEDNVGIRSDTSDPLPSVPVPAHFPEKKADTKKKDKKEKKPKAEDEEDEMTGPKEGDDSEKAAKKRLAKMEKRLKKERESLRIIRAKKAAATGKKGSKVGEDSLRKINKISEEKSKGTSTSKSSSSKRRKNKEAKSQFAKKVAKADSIRQRHRDNGSDKKKHDWGQHKKSKGSKRDKKGETKKDK